MMKADTPEIDDKCRGIINAFRYTVDYVDPYGDQQKGDARINPRERVPDARSFQYVAEKGTVSCLFMTKEYHGCEYTASTISCTYSDPSSQPLVRSGRLGFPPNVIDSRFCLQSSA